MANDKLAEIAMTDPKRAKSCPFQRRKMRYISELEHKVQTLQTEATTLENLPGSQTRTTMKFRIQAMEQQAQLRDALKETLTAEVRRLKLATRELGGDSDPPKGMVSQQLPVNHQIFQLHQQQSSQLNIPHQFQQQQPQSQQQNGNTMTKSELKQ
ncbi:transcription factor RF2a-like [Hibiscus syriacus]|uniref:transcription factor RF2a-like n=1 Tax=Hibiscus syriacus TaxID=106335 RepID=UPI001924FBFE|nr:transcription factor RF2a-like [Hibiscus syriacus]